MSVAADAAALADSACHVQVWAHRLQLELPQPAAAGQAGSAAAGGQRAATAATAERERRRVSALLASLAESGIESGELAAAEYVLVRTGQPETTLSSAQFFQLLPCCAAPGVAARMGKPSRRGGLPPLLLQRLHRRPRQRLLVAAAGVAVTAAAALLARQVGRVVQQRRAPSQQNDAP